MNFLELINKCLLELNYKMGVFYIYLLIIRNTNIVKILKDF